MAFDTVEHDINAHRANHSALVVFIRCVNWMGGILALFFTDPVSRALVKLKFPYPSYCSSVRNGRL